MSWADKVRAFQAKAGVEQPGSPQLPNPGVRYHRTVLLLEEVDEYDDAEMRGDFVEIVDGLVDLIYIAIGTLLRYGVDPDAVFDEVHRSNMTKFPPEGPIFREDGKILKPDTFEPPDIARILGLGLPAGTRAMQPWESTHDREAA